ncbi:MAG: glutamate--tRNA ligase family protein, partial [Acidimicrobiales bacterium]
AVVVDDAAQGVDLVVRADDLLESTSRQLLLYELLQLPAPRYGHVPLVLAPSGDRLAKRHGAVTLEDRAARGESPAQVLTFLAATLGLFPAASAAAGETVTPAELLDRFDFDRLPREPLILPARYLTSAES